MVNKRELSTILYSLRLLQQTRQLQSLVDPYGYFREFEPLTDAQIDGLCKRLNCERWLSKE